MAKVRKIDFTKPHTNLISFMNQNLMHGVDKKTFDWEYFYDSEHMVFSVAENEQGEIIATQSFLPYPLIINNQKIITGKSENSFLDSNYRGKGIFENIYSFGVDECSKIGVQIIWGFTALVKLWREKLGFLVDNTLIYEGYFYAGLPSLKYYFSNQSESGFKKTMKVFFHLFQETL